MSVGMNPIIPACQTVVDKMQGQDAIQEIENVLFSSSTINRCTGDMSHDVEEILRDKLKNSSFSLQVGSTDSSNESYVVAVIRFVNDGEIQENFFCYKELPETSKV
jgi:hypothetical protein